MPRPRLPPEQRKPRTSGAHRAPTEDEHAHQRAVLATLAADVGAELHRRGETGAHPATLAALARVLGCDPATLSRATTTRERARYVRLATLERWAETVRAWIADDATLDAP